jgi:hypothetical protein
MLFSLQYRQLCSVHNIEEKGEEEGYNLYFFKV